MGFLKYLSTHLAFLCSSSSILKSWFHWPMLRLSRCTSEDLTREKHQSPQNDEWDTMMSHPLDKTSLYNRRYLVMEPVWFTLSVKQLNNLSLLALKISASLSGDVSAGVIGWFKVYVRLSPTEEVIGSHMHARGNVFHVAGYSHFSAASGLPYYPGANLPSSSTLVACFMYYFLWQFSDCEKSPFQCTWLPWSLLHQWEGIQSPA